MQWRQEPAGHTTSRKRQSDVGADLLRADAQWLVNNTDHTIRVNDGTGRCLAVDSNSERTELIANW